MLKVDSKETGCESVDQVELDHIRIQWQALMNMNLWIL
jgi:hypothetical protein